MAEIRKPTIQDQLKEIFYPAERIALFVDGANISGTARALSGPNEEDRFQIDYKRLRDVFAKQARLLRAYYYTAVRDDRHDGVVKLVEALDNQGWSCITKPVKYQGPYDGPAIGKGNMDIEIAVDMQRMAAYVDHLLLFSGDGDFRYLIQHIQERGKRVTVVSAASGSVSVLAKELRRQADHFIDLEDLRPLVLRDPKERTRAMLAMSRPLNEGDSVLPDISEDLGNGR